MKTTASNRKLRMLLSGIRNQTLIPRPEFQRRLVWANKHKVAFIQTVRGGFPFPEIYIAAGEVDPTTAEGTEMLVDGQQRITTLYQYFVGSEDLKLGREVKPYNELTPDEQRDFLEYDVVIRDLGQLDLIQIKEVFKRINSTNYSLNAMEVHNSRFEGELKALGEDIAAYEFFERHHIFTSTDIKRMQDLRFVLTAVVTMMSTYFTSDDELESYLTRYNDEFEEKDKYKNEFLATLAFIERCNLSADSRAWKKADFFTLLIELHRLLYRERVALDPANVATALNAFYRIVDDENARANNLTAAEYQRAALQGTNDRSRRVKRGETIKDIITRGHENRMLFDPPADVAAG